MTPKNWRLFCLCSLVVVGLACHDDGGPVEMRPANDGDQAPQMVTDDAIEVPGGQARPALLLLLDGHITGGGDRSVEVARILDAPVHAGPDDPQGDTHWITRSRVLDSDGNTLWTQRVNSLFQLLEFLNVIIEDQAPISTSAAQVYQLAAEEYPDLIQFAVKVPYEIPGGERFVLDVRDDDGDWTELGDYEIAELREQAEAPEPDFDYEINTLVDNGDPADRLDIAILGDGYTADEQTLFEGDAQAVADRFMSTTPMAEHADLFNIHAVWTPSAESGAGYDCNHAEAADDCEQGFRDTVFNTVFVIPALADRFGLPLDDVSDRVAMPINLKRIYEVASLAHYDDIIFISNSQKRSGFAGVYVALVTNYDDRDNFPEVAVHEAGHTLGLLGDEYNSSLDACYFNEPIIPLPANIGLLGADSMKWGQWIAEDTPLPTPNSQASEYPVGAYEGAYNCDFLYRPSSQCKMNHSGHEFCDVCSEQMVSRFYAHVDPAPYQPLTVRRGADGDITLEVPLRDDDRYVVDWLVDGELQEVTASEFTVSAAQLSATQWTTIRASVRNGSEFIRATEHLTTSEFAIDLRRRE